MANTQLLSGNEAIAQGAWEAGCSIGAAYPGTPSTETMETFAKKEGVYAEWCTNEKVALEVALGASTAGVRSLVTMKHVGLNVAADPLFTAAYTGVGAGLVILAADDPGMYSSQNEQDSHYYAAAAHIPMLDPVDSAEALQFSREAFELSEKFDVPVFIRSSVRISHTKTPVEVGERTNFEQQEYECDPSKWVMMPAFAKPRRKVQLSRIASLKKWAETCPYNRIERAGGQGSSSNAAIGVICAGSAYQHVKEAVTGAGLDASIFKLGCTYPLPEAALNSFTSSVEKVYVVEEGSDYLYTNVRACGIEVADFPHELSRAGELSPGLIAQAFGIAQAEHAPAEKDVPPRPPALCPGCPHRTVFRELARAHAIVTGDIGCYTLGALPPLSAMDTCVDMGASVSMAHGFELALQGKKHRPVVAIIGDSTFAHSGLSSLISTIYNRGRGIVCILDNRTTAMTGRQGNPFNGETLQQRESTELNIASVVSACGAKHVTEIDPYDVRAVRAAIKEATQAEEAGELSILVFRHPCVLLSRERAAALEVGDECIGCGVCLSIGCPALAKDEETGHALIDASLCIGCNQCMQYCAPGAIKMPANSENTCGEGAGGVSIESIGGVSNKSDGHNGGEGGKHE